MRPCAAILFAPLESGSAGPPAVRNGTKQGNCVRVGSTDRRSDAAQAGEMRRNALGQALDEQPLPDLDSEAEDFRVDFESFKVRW